jgi:1,4-dihydroxy-2-naphthoate octaprenyltransferase
VKIGNFSTWLLATRPKTLPAGLVPVLIGSALAFRDHLFDTQYFFLTAVCALLIQIITNFINEIYDYKKGADTEERIGPERAVASGKIDIKVMTAVSTLLIIITFSIGMLLVYRAGYEILIVGLSSLFFAWAYTGGPYPLAYKGLGELFVLIYFGIVAVAGTYAVLTLNWTLESAVWGLVPGLISMNILGVNNIRDIDTDLKVNKMTTAARLGKTNAKRLYILIFITLYLIHLYFAITTNNVYLLLPLITFPLTVSLCKGVMKAEAKEFNMLLSKTGLLLILHGLITSFSIIL